MALENNSLPSGEDRRMLTPTPQVKALSLVAFSGPSPNASTTPGIHSSAAILSVIPYLPDPCHDPNM
ncbi:hypothetical protein VP1G_11079 [Cytospora mali]|uniref:Uncharacterized protein n=1 Tax=Cytospora mali TaxID=578113 RepID=A0A194V7C9_CYTMA|nr:hypothetical protein VP1G_11079 [Valsa mali var. pyri (nom. inval.)]